jgi:hypothetical protein
MTVAGKRKTTSPQYREGATKILTTFFARVDMQPTSGAQGCQIFLGTTHQNGENIPNDQKI